MGEGPGITRLGQIQIRTHDVERAAEFYEKVLGLKLLFKAPPGLAFFDCGGVRLMLGVPEGEGAHLTGTVIYYRVEDIHAAAAALRERGVENVQEPQLIARRPDHDLWMTFFRDTEDNLLALMSEVKR